MPAPQKPLLRAAEPKYGRTFDPWNSTGLGHQRAETKGPQGWRQSRFTKMNAQLQAGQTGGERATDTAGAGSEDFDEKLGMLVPKEVRARAARSVTDMLRQPGTMKAAASGLEGGSSSSSMSIVERPGITPPVGKKKIVDEEDEEEEEEEEKGGGEACATQEVDREAAVRDKENNNTARKMFDGVVVYVNGSTHPVISDHKLKRLLAEHGARLAIHLGRRQVTHVLLGRSAGGGGGGSGAGVGLAGGKIEKEIRRLGGCGVKFVGVEWVLESVKAGKRLPEARYANMNVVPRGQRSVLGAFSRGHNGRAAKD